MSASAPLEQLNDPAERFCIHTEDKVRYLKGLNLHDCGRRMPLFVLIYFRVRRNTNIGDVHWVGLAEITQLRTAPEERITF